MSRPMRPRRRCRCGWSRGSPTTWPCATSTCRCRSLRPRSPHRCGCTGCPRSLPTDAEFDTGWDASGCVVRSGVAGLSHPGRAGQRGRAGRLLRHGEVRRRCTRRDAADLRVHRCSPHQGVAVAATRPRSLSLGISTGSNRLRGGAADVVRRTDPAQPHQEARARTSPSQVVALTTIRQPSGRGSAASSSELAELGSVIG